MRTRALLAASVLAVAALAACSSPKPATPSSTPDPSFSRSAATRPPDSFPSSTPGLPVRDAALPFDAGAHPVLPGRLVLAHYLPAFTVSIDNKPAESDYYTTGYLAADGENGKHAAYGGYLRDRPVPRAPRPQRDWQLRDLQDEVRTAYAAGIDGFVLDIVQTTGDNDVRVQSVQEQLMKAAAVEPRFKVVLMPDMTGGMRRKSVDEVARYVAKLAASPSAMRLSDGRLVVAPFTAENHSAAWWKKFMDRMASSYGLKVALVPLFQDERAHDQEFKDISYGYANWGARNPASNETAATSPDSPVARVDAVHRLGKIWMQPVSVQDERPSQQIYDEAENTTNLRNTWQIARDSGSEWVQIATWNDYAEGTQVAPSVMHGQAYLDLVSYYATWFKTGVEPTVARDVVYLTHRTQPAAATGSESEPMVLRDGSSPARDKVEALVFLTEPSTVSVKVGATTTTCDLPAGVGVCLAPLRPGAVSARVVRGGAAVASVVSPFPVVTSPDVQDLQYVAASSAR
jgi:hypothetical protein